jgi:hypothetical protein
MIRRWRGVVGTVAGVGDSAADGAVTWGGGGG